MARQARIAIPGVAHHVTQRGNYRQDVFFTDDDRRVYLAKPALAAASAPIPEAAPKAAPTKSRATAAPKAPPRRRPNKWLLSPFLPEWKATLEAIAACDDIIQRVRLHTRTGRPLGGDTFLSKIETCLGRRIRANPRGRPKGSADKTPRHRRAQSAPAPET
jgi:hypothetical protein